jgi:small subunit ribosomal protein S1
MMADGGGSFAEMFDGKFATPRAFSPGEQVEATVVRITGNNVFLDVGGKSEGYVSREELLDKQGELTVQEGDRLKVYFLSAQRSEMLFTTRLGGGGGAGQAHLEEAFAARIPVEGTVEKEIKGGFEVKLAGTVRAFCPYSQVDLRRVEEPAALVGRSLTFLITQYAENGRNIVLSRRQLLEEEQQEKRRELQKSLAVGAVVSGVVTSIRPFGAFIDIGGLEGLLPVSEIGWGHVDDINSRLEVGQRVEVVVLKLDWENNRFSFSLKQALPDPWREAAHKFPVGSMHSGRVARLATFGAFVTLAEGIDGLIHISALSGGRKINHPREVVKEGETVEVRIDQVDPEQRRISLSLAAAVRAADEEAKTDEEVREYIRQTDRQDSGGMGTLGDLFGKKPKKP